MPPTFESPAREKNYRDHLAFFDRTAHVDVDGRRFGWTEEDLEALALDLQETTFAPEPFDVSVFECTVTRARKRFRPGLKRAAIFELCAATLHTTVENVEAKLQFVGSFEAMHDGGDPASYHPYPPTEE